jgi:hypothetical protein
MPIFHPWQQELRSLRNKLHQTLHYKVPFIADEVHRLFDVLGNNHNYLRNTYIL